MKGTENSIRARLLHAQILAGIKELLDCIEARRRIDEDRTRKGGRTLHRKEPTSSPGEGMPAADVTANLL